MNQASRGVSASFTSAGAFVDELVRSGVGDFVVCPGSRSTPLALSVARHPGAALWMHVDERSAGFFALGIGKLRRRPAAVVTTSGSAAANLLPAVVEARYARVPLLVLTADRPSELRESGASQTIDQAGLYGAHAKWFVDAGQGGDAAVARSFAARAVASAVDGPAGAVHVNFPFDEPLVGASPSWEWRDSSAPTVGVSRGRRLPPPGLVERLVGELRRAPKGLIVCGPLDQAGAVPAIARLAAAAGYPILADPLSQMRCGEHDRRLVVDAYDVQLRDETFAADGPGLVLRFGAIPTSKAVQVYLQRHPTARQIVIDGDGGWRDPSFAAGEVVHVDEQLFADALAEALESGVEPVVSAWRRTWVEGGREVRAALQAELATVDELFEGKVFSELADVLPDGAVLFVGNSMPVRDLDAFLASSDRRIRFLANRGANGIDGVTSTALGAAAAGARPLVLVVGDLSFYHDMNGLLAARAHRLDATIVLLNNDGGGIFSFLPQADDPTLFETLFGTPHGLDFRHAAELYGAAYARVSDWSGFRAALARSLGNSGLSIVEVPTERTRNVTLHRRLWQASIAAAGIPAR